MVEATIGVRDALRGICAHPERTGFMMRCAEAVVSGPTGCIGLNQLYGLAIGENVHHLNHRSVHRCPKIVVVLRRGQRHRCAPDTVLVCGRVEIDATRMRRQIVEVCRCNLANTANCNCNLRVGRSAQLVVEINVRHFPEQLVLGTHSIARRR